MKAGISRLGRAQRNLPFHKLKPYATTTPAWRARAISAVSAGSTAEMRACGKVGYALAEEVASSVGAATVPVVWHGRSFL
jgi:hypothetical protein